MRLSRATIACGLLTLAGPCFGALAIERLDLHQFEGGPILEAGHVFLPGETVYISGRVAGYQTVALSDGQRGAKISWRIEIKDASGIAVVPDAAGRIETPVFAQDKDWHPRFVHSFLIPPFAPSGPLQIEVNIQDDAGKAQTHAGLEVRVRGHDVAPSDVLAARDLHFQRSENDTAPLDPAAYHPGETLWARFDITGYKYGPKNRYSVEYGLAILRESGEQVFAQPAAASDSSESFYPQRYVPGAISLHLDPAVSEGAYTLVITMRDKVGEQSAEARASFRIAH